MAVHLLLLLALLSLSRSNNPTSAQSALQVIDLRALPPPRVEPNRRVRPATKASEVAPGPMKKPVSNAQASETAPAPPVQAPASPTGPPAPVSLTPGSGSGQGGAGSGGGNGSGAGGQGSTGDDDYAEPPRLTSPVMNERDFPHGLLEQWPRGATVFLRLRVDPGGFVTECIIDRGTGVAAIDSVICNMAHERLRFRPALNRSGQKVAGWFGYAQPAPQ